LRGLAELLEDLVETLDLILGLFEVGLEPRGQLAVGCLFDQLG
jgi:hypothetical protein